MIFSDSLTDRVAIVTGASRGIGKAIALGLADAGANLVVASRTVPDLENTADEIRSKGRRALVVKTDTSNSDDIQKMVEETLREFGTIDILVNNGARGMPVPFMKLREDGWDKILNVGLKGYYLCAQAVGRVMIENMKGNIINVASMNATFVDPYSPAYGVAKAGVVQMTRILGASLGRYDIRVNAIAPGFIKTKMTEALWGNPDALDSVEKVTPLRRIGKPEDIAAVAVFLASDASSFITGETIYADGGITLSGFSPDLIGKTMPAHLQL